MRICTIENCNQPVFGTDKKTKMGFCKSHQYKRTDLDKRSISQKAMERHKAVRLATKIYKDKPPIELSKERLELEKWYETICKKIDMNPYCWNCGKRITKPFYRAACAHVIPKRKNYGFPSVATHPANYLILGAGCGCHSKYDMCWEDAKKLKVWEIAVERFKAIYPSIDESEHKNIPEILLESLI